MCEYNKLRRLSIESDNESLSNLLREVVSDMFNEVSMDDIFDDEFDQEDDQAQNMIATTRRSKRNILSSAGESALTTSFEDEVCKCNTSSSMYQENSSAVISQSRLRSSNRILVKPTLYESSVNPRTIRRTPHKPNHRNVELNDSIVGIMRPHLRYSKGEGSTPKQGSRCRLSNYLKKKKMTLFGDNTGSSTDVKLSIRTASTVDESAMDDSWYSLRENDADDDWTTMKCVEFCATMEVYTFQK